MSVLSLLALVACGTQPRPVEDLVWDGARFVDPATGEAYTGEIVSGSLGEPGAVALRSRLLQGVFEGPYQAFSDTGELFETGTYRAGLREGPYTAYWADTELTEAGTYRRGIHHGTRAWYLGDRLIELATYAHGELSGNYERYAEDGTLLTIGVLLGGEPCGLWFEGAQTIEYTPCGVATE